MNNEENTPVSRDELFREKARTYIVCYSTACQLRDHCLRAILTGYQRADDPIATSVNLNNPAMQTDRCPMFRDSTPVRMPFGLRSMYHDMPGWMERSIKQRLIGDYSRKRYYEYHNGTRPLTPAVERHVREVVNSFGWQEEPVFMGCVEEYVW